MKVYITKYALTRGILIKRARLHSQRYDYVIASMGRGRTEMFKNGEWFKTPRGARNKISRMQTRACEITDQSMNRLSRLFTMF